MKNKLMISVALVLCAWLMLSGCSMGEPGGGNVPEDGFKPAVNDGESSELYRRYEELSKTAELSFATTAPTSEQGFEIQETEGGVKIIEYIGEDKVARIPEKIGGKPVVSIGERAFSDKNMRALYIPDCVESVECGALDGCDGMLTLRLPKIYGGFLGYIFGADEYGENALALPVSLDTVILGELTGDIGENAFAGCRSISAVKLPDTARSIGKFAFYECSDLVYVDLGAGVSKIDEYAFAECQNLYALDMSNVTDIGLGVLHGCRSLNSLTISVIGNGENAYLGYIFGAESVEHNGDYVASSLRVVRLTEGCKEIAPLAFSGCDKLTEVITSEGLQSIGVRAFYRCRSLLEIRLADTLKAIGDDAFFGCESLRAVKLGEGLQSLGMQAFFGCKSLESAELPQTLNEIKASTFYGCSALKTVSLGGVKRVLKDAFFGCESLAPVNTEGLEITEGNTALTGIADEQGK